MTPSDASQRETPQYRGWHFEHVLCSLTVDMIMTGKRRLETCRAADSVSSVRERVEELEDDYDHLPVRRDRRYIGFFAVDDASDPEARAGASEGFSRLSRNSLVGADTPILNFLSSPRAPQLPCLVVSGCDALSSSAVAVDRVAGLVTRVDLLKPPVELVLGALLLELEHRMVQRIHRDKPKVQPSPAEHRYYSDARRDGSDLDLVYYTGLPTKLTALNHVLDLSETDREDMRGLRNDIFHVRFRAEYRPERVQDVVRLILRAIGKMGPPSPQGANREDRIRGHLPPATSASI